MRFHPLRDRMGIAAGLFYAGAQEGNRAGCPVDEARGLHGDQEGLYRIVVHGRGVYPDVAMWLLHGGARRAKLVVGGGERSLHRTDVVVGGGEQVSPLDRGQRALGKDLRSGRAIKRTARLHGL